MPVEDSTAAADRTADDAKQFLEHDPGPHKGRGFFMSAIYFGGHVSMDPGWLDVPHLRHRLS